MSFINYLLIADVDPEYIYGGEGAIPCAYYILSAAKNRNPKMYLHGRAYGGHNPLPPLNPRLMGWLSFCRF
jgi:hypothetical protein